MEGWIIVGILAVAFVVWLIRASSPEAMAAHEKSEREATERQARVVCPHCQTAGGVTKQLARRKRGISGGKATGALLTGGVSMLATGLSRKESVMNMSCSNCGMSWDI